MKQPRELRAWPVPPSDRGQAVVEYLLIFAVIALLTVFASSLFQGAQQSLTNARNAAVTDILADHPSAPVVAPVEAPEEP